MLKVKLKILTDSAANHAGTYLGHVVHMARLMVGINNYSDYCLHMKTHHPEQKIMTYEEFFIYKQNARFGSAGGVKCC